MLKIYAYYFSKSIVWYFQCRDQERDDWEKDECLSVENFKNIFNKK